MSELEAKQAELVKAIRELVKRMYSDLHGAYGSADYEGQYEDEIKALADAIINLTID